MSTGHVTACYTTWMHFGNTELSEMPSLARRLPYRMSGCWKMCPQSNVARNPAALHCYSCWKRGGGSASQQPLLCRIHAVKLWLFKRAKQKATAPLLKIVFFPSVSFFLSLRLPPLPGAPPLLLLQIHTLALYLMVRDWQHALREEDIQRANPS